MSVRRNNPIIPSWRVKAGSDVLSGPANLAVEKVFLAEGTPTSPNNNDIALVKLQIPLHISGETWCTQDPGLPRTGRRGMEAPTARAVRAARGAWGSQQHLPHLTVPRPADSTKPICLPYFDEELEPDTPLWVIGWGYTQQNGERDIVGSLPCGGCWGTPLNGRILLRAGKLSEALQQAEVRLISMQSCNLQAYHGKVTQKMLCAGLLEGGVDTCQVRGSTGCPTTLGVPAPELGQVVLWNGPVEGMRAWRDAHSQRWSLAGGQRRASAVCKQALAGGGHRQLGLRLRHPQHTRCLHQRPSVPRLDLRRPQGQCPLHLMVTALPWLPFAIPLLSPLAVGALRPARTSVLCQRPDEEAKGSSGSGHSLGMHPAGAPFQREINLLPCADPAVSGSTLLFAHYCFTEINDVCALVYRL